MNHDDIQRLPLSKIIPHAWPMLLLDRVAVSSAERFECEVKLTEQSEFCERGVVGGWVGLEYMAQTVAALAGTKDLLHGRKIGMGLLLGTQSYVALAPHFFAGQTLRVEAKEVAFDRQGLSMVDCSIRDRDSGHELAHASLTVARVDDLNTLLARKVK